MAEQEKLTLKEMCEKFDVTPRTLRYYEYIELLQPEKEGRTRYFGSTEMARLELILRGRRFGFSLEEIRQWLELYDQDPNHKTQMEAWLEMSEAQIKELEYRKLQLEETIKELSDLRTHAKSVLGK
ncbi:MerR family DNA-binding transcriptional regulator [Amylibacter sp. SFDW26]|uniref:MerR family transcriptional regulator n=1 Tax=Amylibacter sp. SFDW26 TaxID=2652722 RepID=UPI0012625414|nr:MerR family DNA-binding transcriptional regulator [Amylibacter sp. SFDW26]KAB7613666.1 MerR family DNA-binding transcriptional regulator [Amylibacter sp. SFDW26]